MNLEKTIDTQSVQFIVKDACIPKSLGNRREDNTSTHQDQGRELSRAICAEDVI